MIIDTLSEGETIHATAIVLGETGVLFLGPSGSGKSGVAFACLSAAVLRGWNAALVADDRTIVTVRADRLIASCPDPIRGLLELRGAGIVTLPRLDRAVLHLAVALAEPDAATRLPPEGETLSCNQVAIPLMRLWHDGAADPLSCLVARHPGLFLAS